MSLLSTSAFMTRHVTVALHGFGRREGRGLSVGLGLDLSGTWLDLCGTHTPLTRHMVSGVWNAYPGWLMITAGKEM